MGRIAGSVQTSCAAAPTGCVWRHPDSGLYYVRERIPRDVFVKPSLWPALARQEPQWKFCHSELLAGRQGELPVHTDGNYRQKRDEATRRKRRLDHL
jgi:hypothetical protein